MFLMVDRTSSLVAFEVSVIKRWLLEQARDLLVKKFVEFSLYIDPYSKRNIGIITLIDLLVQLHLSRSFHIRWLSHFQI